MAKKKSFSLGRGLGAILGEVEQAYNNEISSDSDLVVEIDIDIVEPNPSQPRKTFNQESLQELSDSIKEYGLLQPIAVYQDADKYYLIAGERRLRASKLANLKTIKAIILSSKPNKIKELAIIENIQRENLNPIDLAQAYRELLSEYNMTHEELASKVSKSRVHITNTLRLLSLDDNIKDSLSSGDISTGHAKAIVGLDSKQQKIVNDSIKGQKLSVKDTEHLIKRIKNKEAKKNETINKEIIDILDDFQNKGISCNFSNNKITFSLNNESDFYLIASLLKKAIN